MFGALSAGFDRLVHPSVTGAAARLRQSRLIGLLLAGSFVLLVPLVALVPVAAGISVTLALTCAVFASAWLAALTVAQTGRGKAVEAMALLAAVPLVATLIAAGGGLASPMALVAVALPLEAWWLCRSRRAVRWGIAAAVGALVLQLPVGAMLFSQAAAHAVHWLAPLGYAALLALRLGTEQSGRREAERAGEPTLADILPAVVVTLTGTGEALDVSEKARGMLGLQPELLLGSGLFDRIHVADRIAYLSALADLRRGAGTRRVEVRLRLPAAKCSAGSGHRPFAIDLVRQSEAGPITALLQPADELVLLREKLDAAREDAASIEMAKARFLAAVSHELRTPLNAIIGFSDMLLHGLFGPLPNGRPKEYVGLIRESGHHLLEVVDSILDVSRIESGAYAADPEPFAFREAVDLCHAMLRGVAEQKGVRLTLDVAADVGELCADRRAVRQILINLVSNAVKFTPAGGTVTLGARLSGGRLNLSVADTGIGMAADDLARVGQPFTQVHNDLARHRDGVGLGLSLVKGLVALHDGTMSIESAPNAGTSVLVTLPLAGPKPRPAQSAPVVMLAPVPPREETDAAFAKTA